MKDDGGARAVEDLLRSSSSPIGVMRVGDGPVENDCTGETGTDNAARPMSRFSAPGVDLGDAMGMEAVAPKALLGDT